MAVVTVVVVVVVVAVVVSVSVIAEKAPGDAMFTKDGSDACDNLLFALSTACRCLLLSISSCENPTCNKAAFTVILRLATTHNSSSNSKYLAACSIRCLYASVVASFTHCLWWKETATACIHTICHCRKYFQNSS